MNHRHVLDQAMRGLPPAKAAYLARVADQLDRRTDLADRGHLLYPVLAAAAPGIEPMLEPAELAAIAVEFLSETAEGIARTLYSPAYLQDRDRALMPWAERLRARVGAVIMDGLATGRLTLTESKVWRIRSDRDAAAFPYGDEEDDDA